MTRSESCPSRFALERFATSGEDAAGRVAAHLAACVECAALVESQTDTGQAYMSSPAAHALRQRLSELDRAASSRRGRPLGRIWGFGGGLAAAAALALVLSFRTRSPGGSVVIDPIGSSATLDEVLTPKGDAQLSLWTGEEDQQATELRDSPTLHPGQRVQPAFGTPKAGFVALVLSVPSGEVIPLSPTDRGRATPVEAQVSTPLGSSFRVDEELGRYRVVAYFSEKPFSTAPLVAGDSKQAFRGLVLERAFEVRP